MVLHRDQTPNGGVLISTSPPTLLRIAPSDLPLESAEVFLGTEWLNTSEATWTDVL